MLYFLIFFSVLFSYLNPSNAWGDSGTGLGIAVAADIAAQVGLHEESGATDRLDVREAEVMFFAPADHWFDGALSLAAHYEGGIPKFELHEAYVGSSKLIPRTRFKIGQYFLGVGRLNQIHRHDWPFITAPKVHNRFFAAEGALDTGVEVTYLTPLPFFFEVTAGVTNGFTFGHDHTAGKKPLLPTHYLRTVNYVGLPAEGGMQIGLNYLGRNDGDGTHTVLLGTDITAKFKGIEQTNLLLQSEIWFRTQTPKGANTQKEFGMYLYAQYHLGSKFFLGLRADYFTDLTLENATGGTVKNFELNFVPTLTYEPSHFAKFRLALNVNPIYEVDSFTRTNKFVEFQSVFILGSHPAHDF